MLHDHEKDSLLDKMLCFLDIARGDLTIKDLEALFLKFSKNDTSIRKHKAQWIQEIRSIMLLGSAHSLFYGRWMTIEYDIAIRDMTHTKKRKTRKRSTTKTEVSESIEDLLFRCWDEA